MSGAPARGAQRGRTSADTLAAEARRPLVARLSDECASRARMAGLAVEHSADAAKGKRKRVRFRNYVPVDPVLAAESAALAREATAEMRDREAGGFAAAAAAAAAAAGSGSGALRLLSESARVHRQLEARLRATVDHVDEIKVASRKPNWDLKRDAARALKRLAKETQRAVVALAEQERKRRREEEGVVLDY